MASLVHRQRDFQFCSAPPPGESLPTHNRVPMVADFRMIPVVADNGSIPMVSHNGLWPMVSHHGFSVRRGDDVCQSDRCKSDDNVVAHDGCPVLPVLHHEPPDIRLDRKSRPLCVYHHTVRRLLAHGVPPTSRGHFCDKSSRSLIGPPAALLTHVAKARSVIAPSLTQ